MAKTGKTFDVCIPDFQIKFGGAKGKTLYTVYNIYIHSPYNIVYTVERRYSEFLTLFKLLKSQTGFTFKGFPPKALFKSVDVRVIEKRRKSFQDFIKKIFMEENLENLAIDNFFQLSLNNNGAIVDGDWEIIDKEETFGFNSPICRSSIAFIDNKALPSIEDDLMFSSTSFGSSKRHTISMDTDIKYKDLNKQSQNEEPMEKDPQQQQRTGGLTARATLASRLLNESRKSENDPNTSYIYDEPEKTFEHRNSMLLNQQQKLYDDSTGTNGINRSNTCDGIFRSPSLKTHRRRTQSRGGAGLNDSSNSNNTSMTSNTSDSDTHQPHPINNNNSNNRVLKHKPIGIVKASTPLRSNSIEEEFEFKIVQKTFTSPYSPSLLSNPSQLGSPLEGNFQSNVSDSNNDNRGNVVNDSSGTLQNLKNRLSRNPTRRYANNSNNNNNGQSVNHSNSENTNPISQMNSDSSLKNLGKVSTFYTPIPSRKHSSHGCLVDNGSANKDTLSKLSVNETNPTQPLMETATALTKGYTAKELLVEHGLGTGKVLRSTKTSPSTVPLMSDAAIDDEMNKSTDSNCDNLTIESEGVSHGMQSEPAIIDDLEIEDDFTDSDLDEKDKGDELAGSYASEEYDMKHYGVHGGHVINKDYDDTDVEFSPPALGSDVCFLEATEGEAPRQEGKRKVGFVLVAEFLEAVKNGDYDFVLACLKTNPEFLEVRTAREYTPVLIASLEGYLDIVELLLENGADVNAVNNDHQGSLHFAALEDDLELFCLLLESGADWNVYDLNGEGPIDYAPHNKFLDVIEMYDKSLCGNYDEQYFDGDEHVCMDHSNTDAIADGDNKQSALLKRMPTTGVGLQSLQTTDSITANAEYKELAND